MNPSRIALNSVAVQRSVATSTARRALLPRATVGLPGYRVPRGGASLLLLAARRDISTQTSTPSAGPPAAPPPPGFNVEEAKKPLLTADPDKPKNSRNDVSSSTSTVSTASSTSRAFQQAQNELASTESPTGVVSSAVLSASTEKAVAGKAKEDAKLTVWQKVKHGAQHFWDGTKLLGVEIRISYKLALKMMAGYELSRREHRQLERTVRDLGRLVPFSVFIIVPAGELFLPVALKFFPNLLPSTYEDQKQKDSKANKLRSTRKDVSQFLRTTMKEGGLLPIGPKTRQCEEFARFFRKVRNSGEAPTREELIKVCKLFKDDITLDNLSRPQLVGMCRYMNLNTFGTDAILRYNIRHRLRQLKRDDRAISFEGVDSLSVPELQNACASRGIRTHGVSPAHLRDDLNTWLELRLKHGLPSTLMVLSNAFMYAQGKESEVESHYDALQAVLSSIPEELYHEMELEVHSAEGAATNKQRLEVVKEQQELIDEENEQRTESGPVKAAPYYDRDIDEKIAEVAVAEKGATGSAAAGADGATNKDSHQKTA